MHALTMNAHAKINLSLTITKRRDDGYHEMESLVVFAGLADRISFAESTADSLIVSGPQSSLLLDIAPESNIITAAKTAYRKAANWHQPFAVTLEKYIPVAAGIGGGSSNAAATLIALNTLNPAPLSEHELMHLGLTIGADVPVCLKQYNAPLWRMAGIGEMITAVDVHSLHSAGLILVNPLKAVATKDVFMRLDHPEGKINAGHFDKADAASWLIRGNDLSTPAIMLEPSIQTCLDDLATLSQHDGYIHHGMSGSGATCFALFKDGETAQSAIHNLPDSTPWAWAGRVA